jgi:hypothetical protein
MTATLHPRLLGALALLVGCGGKTLDAGATTDASSDGAVVDGAPDGSDFTACPGAGTCSLVSRSCCGTCGTPTFDTVTSIATSRLDAYRVSACGSEPIPCPACPAGPPNPNLQPVCASGRCKAIDIHTDPVSACSTTADCSLAFAACCAPCGTVEPWDVIALNTASEGAYHAMVCSPLGDCADCPSTGMPPGLVATCDDTHHCAVVGVTSSH